MSETVENLVLRKERTYQEKMDAWRTSYPQLAVWEEANERGLAGNSLRQATAAGSRDICRPSPDH